MQWIHDALIGGDGRSQGRTKEVVRRVLSHPREMGTLFECLFHEDETVRRRASDALEKVCRERADLLQRFTKRLLNEASKIDQPSVQLRLAQILPHLRLSAIGRRRAVAVLKQNLDHYHDRIVITLTLEALAAFARQNPRLSHGLLELLSAYENDHRKSLAEQAGRLIAEFSGSGQGQKRGKGAYADFRASVQVSGIRQFVDVPADVLHSSALAGSRFVRVRLREVERAKERTAGEGDRKRLGVIGRLARVGWYRSSLIPVWNGNGATRLYFDRKKRRYAGIGEGDCAGITLRPDRRSRTPTIPPAVAETQARHSNAHKR